ncbi:MAG: hypothetical protein IPJ20_19505 [Flammeovirgaceae bacterium]|nr:hypothetical protein [Flammeovirgaceae bacterium]
MNGTNKTQQAKYIYYLHGPLKRIELAKDLQGIDFVYNIHGWLESINHPLASKDPGQDGAIGAHSNFKGDVFGLTLDYFDSEFTGLYQGADAGKQGHSIHGLPQLDAKDETRIASVPYFKLNPAFKPELVDEKLPFKQFSAESPQYKELIARLKTNAVELAFTEADKTELDNSEVPSLPSENLVASINTNVLMPNEIDVEPALAWIPNYNVVWKDLVGVIVSGDQLVKTAPSGWGNAGAATQNLLAASTDGYVEFPAYLSNQFMVGLSDVNVDANYTTIDYAIYSNGLSYAVYSNGSNLAAGTALNGDILRVERVGSSILLRKWCYVLYKNGSPYYQLISRRCY